MLDKDAVVDLQAASISGTRSRQLKKDDKKDNKKDDKKDDKKDTNATNATSTKKDDKKKDDKKKDDKKKCLKVKMPVEEFEKRLRDAFWKVGTMIGVAILTEVDFYEVRPSRDRPSLPPHRSVNELTSRIHDSRIPFARRSRTKTCRPMLSAQFVALWSTWAKGRCSRRNRLLRWRLSKTTSHFTMCLRITQRSKGT